MRLSLSICGPFAPVSGRRSLGFLGSWTRANRGRIASFQCLRALALVAPMAIFAPPADALRMVVDTSTIIDPQIVSSVNLAARSWEAIFATPVEIRLQVLVAPLESNIVANTKVNELGYNYTDVLNALGASAKTAYDAQAISTLTQYLPSPVSFIRNAGSLGQVALVTGDHLNNTRLALTPALALGLGFGFSSKPPQYHAVITINSSLTNQFDFNPIDGVASSKIDLTGTVEHEFGHAFGFSTGVCKTTSLPCIAFDDSAPLTISVDTPQLTTLDLFRYSSRSNAGSRLLPDLSSGTFTSFGISRATNTNGTPGNPITVRAFDTADPKHWSSSIGLMGVEHGGGVIAPDEIDLMAFDVMGWTLRRDQPISHVARLKTGSPVGISASAVLPEYDFIIQFAGSFESGVGSLDVYLENIKVGSLLAADQGSGMQTHQFHIAAGIFSGPATVQFIFDGPTGSIFAIGQISVPGLINGEFESGLEGWNVLTSDQGSVSIAAVPELSIAHLMGAGLLLIPAAAWHRRRFAGVQPSVQS